MTVLAVLLGVFCVLWLQNLIYRRLWSHGLRFSLAFSRETAVAGDTLTITEVLENAKLLPLPWIDVKFQLSGGLVFENHRHTGADSVRCELFSVGPYKRITRAHTMLCLHRGYYTVKSMSVTAQNLLMNEKYVSKFDCAQHLTVYPAPLLFDPFRPAYRRIVGNMRARGFIQPDPFEFRGIREYLPTDPLRSVNHRATAKTGALMVNLFSPTVSQTVTLWLGVDPYSAYPLPEVYEAAISLAATLAEELLGDGLSVALHTGAMNVLAPGQRIHVPGGAGAAHLPRILEALALIDLAQTPQPAAQLLRHVLRPDESGVHILISAYDGEDLELVHDRLSGEGQDITWIVPRRHDTLMRVTPSDKRLFWDVEGGDFTW